MNAHRTPCPWRLAVVGFLTLAAAGVVLGAHATAASAQASPSAEPASPYALELVALTGPQGATFAVRVTPAAGSAPVEALEQLRVHVVSTRSEGDDEGRVLHFRDVPAPGGAATVALGRVERGRQLRILVLFRSTASPRMHALAGEATVRLRPDLVVTAVQAPPQTLTTRPIDVVAQVAERNGDTGATANATLMWGPTPVAGPVLVTVAAGAGTAVVFEDVALTTAVPVELTVVLSDAAPAETDPANNTRIVAVDVTEHELARSRVLVGGLGGYGAQFNQHVYASITPAPPGSLPDLEAKVKAFEPQLVRIFFHEIQERDPDQMASFVEAVELAHAAGATINITYQTAFNAKFEPDLYMGQFAAVLEDLVRSRALTNVRWVTVQNEPNAPNVVLTLQQYNALNRALHAHLVARGLREQIGIMGGDLVESSGARNHRVWFQYMAAEMNDVVDAYSVHIYWNFWDIPRMEFRLRDVRQIVTQELPVEARKPVYITEFGVRGILNMPGKPAVQPGYWHDGTPTSRTNVAAFQQLWFNLASAQLGFDGAVKWDAFWGRYTPGYREAYHLIGPADEGWPLFPAYHSLRLLLQTTQRGWQVLGVDPWVEDDWKVGVADAPEKELAAYAGPDGQLTLLGLDSRGRDLNAAAAETPAYSIAGLPPNTTFNLGVWNAAADGKSVVGGAVVTNALGVARFEVPLHAAFVLTSVPMS